jgi:hypothetical protein
MKLRHFALVAGLALAAALAALAPAKALDLSLDGRISGQCSTTSASGNGTAATATLNNKCGVITTEALTIPTNSNYALTLTNSEIAATDMVFVAAQNGSNTTGIPVLSTTNPSAGSVVVNVRQSNGTAFNGTLKLMYWVFKP